MLGRTKVRGAKWQPTDLLKWEDYWWLWGEELTLASRHKDNGCTPKILWCTFTILYVHKTDHLEKLLICTAYLNLCFWAQLLKHYCKEGRSVLVLTPLLNHHTQQDVAMGYNQSWLLLLAHREGYSNLTDQNWSGAKGLQGKAPECLFPGVTQLFFPAGAPFCFCSPHHHCHHIQHVYLYPCFMWMADQAAPSLLSPTARPPLKNPSVPCMPFILCSPTLVFHSEHSATEDPSLLSLNINQKLNHPSRLLLPDIALISLPLANGWLSFSTKALSHLQAYVTTLHIRLVSSWQHPQNAQHMLLP